MNPAPRPPWLLPLMLTLLFAACGGGGGGGEAAAPPALPAAVARIELEPAAALLPAAGAVQAFSARAYAADGRLLDVTVQWASSNPALVELDVAGRATARMGMGSASVTASAGGVTSAPAFALVAAPAAGVALVDDTQIVGDIVETDPAAEPAATNTYRATLAGGPAPAVGTLLVGRGGKPLAGRVVAVQALGTQWQLTMQLVPLTELFSGLVLDQSLDLANAEVAIAPDVAARFEFTREGNRFSFRPRPGATTSAAPPAKRALNTAVGTHARDILPFRGCEVSLLNVSAINDNPLSLAAPNFAVTLSPSLDVRYDSATGLERLLVRAEPQLEIDLRLLATASISGSVKCRMELFTFRVPIGGPLSLFIGGLVPVGVGFELQGETELATFAVGARAGAAGKVRVGVECLAAGGCGWVRELTEGSTRVEPVVDLAASADELRLNASLHTYAYLEADFGSPLMRSLRLKAFEVNLGGQLGGSFAPPLTQMLAGDYAADYEASLRERASLSLGIGDLLRRLGADWTARTDLSLFDRTQPLARSPRASSIEADRTSFAAGDTVNVTVDLDPATLNFLPGVYNVESVQLRRRVGGGGTALIATQAAASGQQRFQFPVVAPEAGHTSQWSVFVTTRLLPAELLSLELGAAGQAAGVTVVSASPYVGDDDGCYARAALNDPPGSLDIEDEDRQPGQNVGCRAVVNDATASSDAYLTTRLPTLAPDDTLGAERLEFFVNSGCSARQATRNGGAGGSEVSEASAGVSGGGFWVFGVGGTAQRLTATGAVLGGENFTAGFEIRVPNANGSTRIRWSNAHGTPLDAVLQPGEQVMLSLGAGSSCGVSGSFDAAGAAQSSNASDVTEITLSITFTPER